MTGLTRRPVCAASRASRSIRTTAATKSTSSATVFRSVAVCCGPSSKRIAASATCAPGAWSAALQAAGCEIDIENVKDGGSDDTPLGRPHVAKALVRAGIASDVDAAFRNFLAPGQTRLCALRAHHTASRDRRDRRVGRHSGARPSRPLERRRADRRTERSGPRRSGSLLSRRTIPAKSRNSAPPPRGSASS